MAARIFSWPDFAAFVAKHGARKKYGDGQTLRFEESRICRIHPKNTMPKVYDNFLH